MSVYKPTEQTATPPFIRIAELEVDPARCTDFAAAAARIAAAALRTEPGCLALLSAADADAPNRFTIFEIYRDEAAYQAHLATPHFQAFRASTDTIVLSRRLRTASAAALMLRPDWQVKLGSP